ncbi:cache domain-containing protein [Marinobacterium aestuariivivens]|uniref:Oxygen sensor histidine kinase NreB n=1 Tax=Marinobacterium aestuariivivens TaxID=1698799 RepID=A0ABW2A642_9GAMM
MSLKAKLLLLAILPLILVTALVTMVSLQQAHRLSEQEIRIFEENLLGSKRRELQHYVSLALTSIDHIVANADAHDEAAKAEVKRILSDLTFGDDGYFFVYDQQGQVLVHPILTELVGRNLLRMRDERGDPVIRTLLQRAREGGGFHRYLWQKPSRGESEEKLSYVVLLPKWNWMLGTGLYIDDIAKEVTEIRREVNRNIRNTFFTVLLIVSAAVALIVMIAIALNLHESRLANARLRSLAHKSIQLQVSQRRGFARELHDGINQLMVSVKYRIEVALNKLQKGDHDVAADLCQGMAVLNDAIREVRRVSHDLRPSILDDLGLEPALRNLLEEFRERTGILVDLQLKLPGARLTDDIEITLYRVVQEALTNIQKHADASRLQVRCRYQGGLLRLQLQDNGCGFDPKNLKKQAGIGLRNMRDRLELLGGEFELDSAPGEGTRIRVALPGGGDSRGEQG